MRAKHLFPALALGLLGLSVITINTGCKKSSGGSNTAFAATVNGTSFNPNIVNGVYFKSNGGYIQVTGTVIKGGDTTFMDVYVFDSVHVNEPLDFLGGGMDYGDSKTGKFYNGDEIDGHGMIRLTAWDTTAHKIAGTFSGVLVGAGNDSVVVTNGTFNSSYIVQ